VKRSPRKSGATKRNERAFSLYTSVFHSFMFHRQLRISDRRPLTRMPLITETTKDCQGILHVGTGTVTGEEFVRASYAALLLFQNTQNFQYEFVDLSNATGLQIAEEHLAQITAQDRVIATFRPNAVVVVVAPGDEFYQLGKDWECAVQELGWNTHISRERSEALAWLHKNLPARAKSDSDAGGAD
jgi:hypothetical protein